MDIFSNIVIRKQDNPYESRNERDDRFYRAFAEISNGELDTDGHIMGEDTLKNFARDAKAGVQVKDSHEYKNGFGRTIDGRYDDAENRVLSGLRISRDMDLGENKSYPNSNSFIMAIEDEIITQVSIGAYGGDLICNICDASMYSSRDCYHWPLITYLISDDEGRKEAVLCTATYVGGKLREVSLVDKGACPGAEILKSRLEGQVSEGVISDSHVYLVKSMYGFAEGTSFSHPSMRCDDPNTKIVDSVKDKVGDSDTDKNSNTDTDNIHVADMDRLDFDDSKLDQAKSKNDDNVDKLEGSKSDPADDEFVDDDDSSNDNDDTDNSKDNRGDDTMDLDQAKKEIARLEKKQEELENQSKKDKLKIEEFASIEAELQGEKKALKNELVPIWKELRTNFTGEELTRYEKRVDSMDIWNLKEEKLLLDTIIEKQKAAEAAQSSDDSDDGDDGDDSLNKSQDDDSSSDDKKSSNRKTQQDPKKGLDKSQSNNDDDMVRPPAPGESRLFAGL